MEVEQVVVRLVADTTQYFRALDYAGARLIGYSAGLVTAITKHGIEMAAQFEKNSVAVKVMTGDIAAGTKLINDLTKLAIDTPFSSEELIGVTKQLKAFGFETNQIIPALEVLGNVSSGTGTDINRIALAFGQVKVAGKLMGTELRQFVDAGVPLITYLAKVMGKPEESIRTLVEQGRVGFDEVVQAFNLMNAKGEKFAGLMDVISRTTIGGRWQAFKESLDVGARNFAMAAMEGLGLKNVLADITDQLQGIANGSQNKTVEVFRTVRSVVEQVYAILKAWVYVVVGIHDAAYKWIVQNQYTLKVVGAILGTIWSIRLAIMAATVAFTAMRSILISIYAISGLLQFMSTVWSMVSAIGTLASTLASLAIPLAVLSGIAVLFHELASYASMGNGLNKFIEQFGVLKDAYQSFIKAVQAGDMETAFDIAVNGIKLLFRSLFLMIKVEMSALWEGMIIGAKSLLRTIPRQFSASLARGFYEHSPFHSRQEAALKIDVINDNLREQLDTINKEVAEAQRLAAERSLKLADQTFAADEALRRYTDNINKASKKIAEQTNDRSGLEFIQNNSKLLDNVRTEIASQLNQLYDPTKQGVFSEEGLRKYAAIDIELGKQNANLFKEASALLSLRGMKTPWGDIPGKDNSDNKSIYSIRTDSANKDSIYHLLSDTSKALVDKFTAAYGIDTAKSSIRVFPNPYNDQVMDAIKYAQMAAPFSVSAKARETFNHFTKELDKGATEWIENVEKMKAIQEAYYGSVKGQQIAGVAGGFALAGKMGGLDGAADVRRYADLKFYEAAEKMLQHQDRIAPDALYGSSASVDIINRNLTARQTTEQEVLAVLTAAKDIADEQLRRMTQIQDAMQHLRDSGKLKLLRIE